MTPDPTKPQQTLDPTQPTQLDQFEDIDEDDQRQLQEQIAHKFYTLSSAIEVSFAEAFNLIGKRQEVRQGLRGKTTYFVLKGEEDEMFNHEMTNVNKNLGTARTILDSYISFTKSVPDFNNFFNKFFHIYKTYITNHRKTVFFRVNAQNGKYMYPFYEIHDGLQELGFLFARLCGTLGVGGDYIRQPPPMHRQPILGGGLTEGDRAYRPMDYYSPGWESWRGGLGHEDDIMNRVKKNKFRDIGDTEDR